ncbi:hypothetical protein LTR37_001929 [Vermiconidia calcicola]|uniref:Uncharacterized protein n=1 Tax=Vermiconidia calcicola TaxID=1690605 RepID=A0ACC3NUL7_9PEZI|nr:hypothetical protein LTR37_001929 [Vermiconidia calcicola]
MVLLAVRHKQRLKLLQSPNYPIGNGLNLATSSTILLLSIGMYFFMKADNARREKKDIDAELAGLEQKQIQDLDWKHPGFKWRP